MVRRDLLTYIVLITLVVFSLIPVFWGLATSLKPLDEINRYPPILWPKAVTFDSYYKVLFYSNFPTYFVNSVLVTAVSVVTSVVVAAHAAYAFARFRVRYRAALMFLILMTSMVPVVALLIPLYRLTVATGIYNTRLVMVLIYTAWRTPILIWVLYGFFKESPVEVEEAALVDGCSRPAIFYRIVIPISQAGLISGALLSAIYIWNDFLIAFTFTTEEGLRLISVGLYNYITQYGIQWGELMAAVMIAIVPIIAFFLPLQKRFVSGLASGAVKG